MITLISALGSVPTVYPFEGYGGIERIVADTCHALVESGEGVRLVAGPGSHVHGCEIIQHPSEWMGMLNRFDGSVIDFSHNKIYNYAKYSVPFWTDRIGANPIFPTKAVMYAFGAAEGNVIYPGVDLGRYHIAEEKEDYYLFFGRIAPYKGTETLLQIVRELGIRVIVAGHDGAFTPPGYAETFRDKCRSLGIEYLGQVNEDRKRDLLAGAKGLIFPADWRFVYNDQRAVESFGITAVEAIASGTPVFTNTRPSGIREIISGGFGGAYDVGQWGAMLKYQGPSPDKWKARRDYFTAERYAKELIAEIETRIHQT